jgi:23S rRNA (uracil1939-C5)-methyltransferase
VEEYLRDFSVPAYDEKTRRGLARHIFVRTNKAGQALVCLVINGKKLPHEPELVERVRAACPETAGVVLCTNTRDTNVVLGDRYRTLWGQDTLTDTLCGLDFSIAIPAFFQVNRPQAERLYQKAAELAGLTGNELVLDLYCGAGTITLTLAGKARKVIGAEIVPEAVENARENARRNHIENAEFFLGDAGEVASHLAGQNLHPDVVVVDPPRKGLSEQVIAAVAAMGPGKVVYVSCDSATLARDVKRFAQAGYQLRKAVAVDMFPRTRHCETVVQLSQRKPDDVVEVDLDLDELDITSAETKATYNEIKQYVLEQTGLRVTNLYIAQVKQKCGIIERENYNKPKSENSKQPKCTPEKEVAILDALKHFNMI